VAAAANRPVPWAVCLPQAVAGHWMLRRRRIASAVCFGVARDHEAKLGAHAWLRIADRVVLGQKAMAGFTPIAEFPDRAPLTRSVD
jgi:transglutaminase superfamily protein